MKKSLHQCNPFHTTLLDEDKTTGMKWFDFNKAFEQTFRELSRKNWRLEQNQMVDWHNSVCWLQIRVNKEPYHVL